MHCKLFGIKASVVYFLHFIEGISVWFRGGMLTVCEQMRGEV